MIQGTETPVSVLTPASVVARTATIGRHGTNGHRRGAESVDGPLDADPESLAETLSLSVGIDADTCSTVVDVHRAVRRGWIGLTYESPTFRGLNKLVAWVLSAGYVTVGYTPYFGIRHGADYERLDRAFDRLRCRYEPDGDDPHPPRRARPSEAPTALGRVLATLGAPVGPPTERTTLPEYLHECPEPVLDEFVYTYLNNRSQYPGTERPDCERRSPAFRRELAAVLTRVVGSPVAIDDGELVPPSEPGAYPF